MDQGTNPAVPAAWEFMVTAMAAVILALTVAAVISLARDRTLTPGTKFLCLLGILGFPVLGPGVWFFHLYRVRRSRRVNRTEPASPAANRQHQGR